ncbi:sulfur carrier protein ThiS [Mesonia sp. K7]|uniref:sulfur carrier protein ThiS n=1 Tax=Mesonia sp. K7 TaxID=2218606 RepID=UPI000DA9CF25|nr:sulfur carrier protein ThiS [Mesonia sp. K7]PZD78104.1 thiamine biosynthesis protein ThiS [Mesonia sp. K7]
MITVNVNSTHQEISEDTNITQLLAHLHHSGDGIAVAINQEVISKNDWNTTRLVSGDDILIIQATQGG